MQKDGEYDHLGSYFKELGFVMMELGIYLAQICDRAFGGHELEQSLMESSGAKARLIHYHSMADSLVLRQSGKILGINKGKVSSKNNFKQQNVKQDNPTLTRVQECDISSSLWQQWHYDYECPYPDGQSHLRIFDPKKGKVFMVKTAPESFLIQVGESADILSKGKLRSTLHCVHRPLKHEDLSRETFVLFLQPAWTKTFTLSYPVDQLAVGYQGSKSSDDECHLTKHDRRKLTDIISKIVPPLTSRLKDGMSFAEFARETTKQYYGGSGMQANR